MHRCFGSLEPRSSIYPGVFLGASGFPDFALHRPTNTVPVSVRSLAADDRICSLWSVPLSCDSAVPVQAYLTSGSDFRRCVISGVYSDELPETLVAALTCSTPTAVQKYRAYLSCHSSGKFGSSSKKLPIMSASFSFTITVPTWCIATHHLVLDICEPLAHYPRTLR